MSSSPSRLRILDAALELVLDRGPHAVTLAEIASASGVSRQAVYLQFGNRAGLLLAVARHLDERSGIARRLQDAFGLPAAQALEATIRAWCDYVPTVLPLGRALDAARVTGDDGAAAWEDRMRDLRGAFRVTVRNLEAEGRLAPGWSVKEATDWIYAATHLSTYDRLVGDRKWPPATFVERTVGTLLRDLVAPG